MENTTITATVLTFGTSPFHFRNEREKMNLSDSDCQQKVVIAANSDDDDDDGDESNLENYRFWNPISQWDSLFVVKNHDESSSIILSSYFILAIFYLLGIGLLVPWNAFVSAQSYFYRRTCRDVEKWLGVVYNLSSLLTLSIMNSRFPSCCPRRQVQQSTESNRHDNSLYFMVMIPLSIYLLVFIMNCIVMFLPVSAEGIFLITLASLAICGAMGALASAGLIATASSTSNSTSSLGSLLSGQAVGGVVVSSGNFIAAILGKTRQQQFWDQTCSNTSPTTIDQFQIQSSILIQNCLVDSTVDWATFMYFAASSLLLIACIVGYQVLQSSMTSRQYQTIDDENIITATEQSLSQGGHDDNDITLHNTWNKISQPALAIFFTFLVTLSIFPAWTSSLQSAHQCQSQSRIFNDLFSPFTFVWFNVMDLLGRWCAEKYSRHFTSHSVIPYALARSSLWIFFAILPSYHHSSYSFYPSKTTSHLTPIQSDFLSLTMQAALGFTNGFLLTWGFLLASGAIVESREQVQSSRILNFSLSLGLFVGSMLSVVYIHLISVIM
jgi:solute carrier family 29 (equilibrative nucleoside transporter), member 1/2/3